VRFVHEPEEPSSHSGANESWNCVFIGRAPDGYADWQAWRAAPAKTGAILRSIGAPYETVTHQRGVVTPAQLAKVARLLSDRIADFCSIERDENWDRYSAEIEGYTMECAKAFGLQLPGAGA
jgi:predicted flap endonuclease-1-like 5' DNA nuclease